MSRRLTVKNGTNGPGYPYNGNGEYVFEGDFEFEVEEFDHIVRVTYWENGPEYNYRDLAGTLKVGDRVLVPVGDSQELNVATVSALGRGRYTGPVKDVADKLNTSTIYRGQVRRAQRRPH